MLTDIIHQLFTHPKDLDIQPVSSTEQVFCCLLIIFKSIFLEKILSGIPSVCQTAWIQSRPDLLSGLTWVQTVCHGYQQTTLAGKELTSID